MINGDIHVIAENLSLQKLVEHLQLAPERIAIELNHTVVRRARWPETILQNGDRVEVVHFVGGGAGSGRQEAGAGGRRQEQEAGALHL